MHKKTDLEGLVAYKDVTIHSEAKLSFAEEGLVCFQVFAICERKDM